MRIQERDRRMVRDVFLHRVVRRDDLIGLGHFNSVPRCNQRLSQLVSAKWLRRIDRVNGLLVGQGVYAPGPAATGFLMEELDVAMEEAKKQSRSPEGPLLIEHALRVLDFRQQLTSEVQRAGLDSVEWLCEPECLHEFQSKRSNVGTWTKTLVKPDAYFLLETPSHRLDCFLEADLGHVALPRFAEKLRTYDRYVESGAFRDAYRAEGFCVLTVTVGERRLSNLAALPTKRCRHLLTTWARLERAGILRDSWTGAGGSRVSLLGAASRKEPDR